MKASAAARVGRELRKRGWSLAVAESCTGGLLGSMITDIPKSSEYFRGGVIAYSNRIKEEVLGVGAGIIRREGAVSGPVARSLARAAAKILAADVGVGVTGIAGPGGGSPRKPVGLVFVSVVTPGGEVVRRYRLSGDRNEIRRSAALRALDLLLSVLRTQ